MRESRSLLASFANFNLDFWLTIPPMIVSVSLDFEANLAYFGGLLIFALSLATLSAILDGRKGSIMVPLFRGNPRLAYNLIENKRLIHMIKGEEKSPSNYLINF